MTFTLPLNYIECFGAIQKSFDENQVQQGVLLESYTTFRIGGKSDFLISPTNNDQIALIINLSNKYEVPYHILGHGSNLLIDSNGMPGIIIRLASNFSNIQISNNILKVQAGASLATIAKAVARVELGGFSCLCGIPGSLGGAIYMNAGAYGCEISDHLSQVTVLTQEGTYKILTKKELNFSYRNSLLQDEPLILLDATFELPLEKKESIFAKMKECNCLRNTKQPMDLPSAGSAFKRPKGFFAAALIDQSGLSGARIGDAMISTKHAGFIVNVGNATFEDVKALISLVKNTVFEKFNVVLEPEIKIWERMD